MIVDILWDRDEYRLRFRYTVGRQWVVVSTSRFLRILLSLLQKDRLLRESRNI